MRIGKDGRPVMDEESVISLCLDVLNINGARAFRVIERIPWGAFGKKSQAGIPDVFGWWPDRMPYAAAGTPGKGPRHFFIEFKRPKGKRRPAQIRWISEAKGDGVMCFFSDSLESMIAEFRDYGIQLRGFDGR